MENQELQKLIQQLHDEIQNTQAIDEQSSELLRDLEGDIGALLERSEENLAQEQAPSVVERLESAVKHFEVTHPELTMLISKVMESLSNAGI